MESKQTWMTKTILKKKNDSIKYCGECGKLRFLCSWCGHSGVAALEKFHSSSSWGPATPCLRGMTWKHTHTNLCAAVCSFVHNHPKLKTTQVSTRRWQISKLVFLCDETVLTQQLRKRSLAFWHGWVSDTSCRVEGQIRQPAYYVMPSVWCSEKLK